jgi:hypothetical protein
VAADLKRIAKRSGAAWAAKDLWRGMLDDAYEFCLPMRNRWSTQSEGEQKMDRVFDSTAIEATQRFSSRLQSQLTPPFQHWADLTAGPIVPPDQLQMVQAKLQTITKQLFAAIHASNFDTSIGEVYLDGAITTAAMLVLEGDDNSPLNFIAAPSHTFATDDGVYGGVDGVFRRWEAPVREIRSTWPEADISADMEKIERDTPEKKLKLQEATFWDQKQGYYCYVVWEEATAANGEPHKIVERKYQEHPWVVFQWMKVAGESQARGPALYVLPDIKTLNKTKELILKNASLAVSGVWTAVDDGVINPDTVEIVPGAVIGVESAAGTSRRCSSAGASTSPRWSCRICRWASSGRCSTTSFHPTPARCDRRPRSWRGSRNCRRRSVRRSGAWSTRSCAPCSSAVSTSSPARA